jgi:hypothetical protein
MVQEYEHGVQDVLYHLQKHAKHVQMTRDSVALRTY